jgi:hypothetical protein
MTAALILWSRCQPGGSSLDCTSSWSQTMDQKVRANEGLPSWPSDVSVDATEQAASCSSEW